MNVKMPTRVDVRAVAAWPPCRVFPKGTNRKFQKPSHNALRKIKMAKIRVKNGANAVALLRALLYLSGTLSVSAFVPPHPKTTSCAAPAASSSLFATTAPTVQMADSSHPLIQKANEFIYTQSGFYSPYDESAFSDEFVFRGPYVGPLTKRDYLSTMSTFGIYRAIPDISPNAFGWSIDPNDPNRVWFLVRNTGTFDGEPLGLGNGLTFPPNGKQVEGCPETFSILFDEDQKVKYLSVGYVADRFEGNTDGKGAAVGVFNAVGLPLPKPGRILRFAQWFYTEVVGGGPLFYSTQGIPRWWTNKDIASDGYS